jgi:hypothetical protein
MATLYCVVRNCAVAVGDEKNELVRSESQIL